MRLRVESELAFLKTQTLDLGQSANLVCCIFFLRVADDDLAAMPLRGKATTLPLRRMGIMRRVAALALTSPSLSLVVWFFSPTLPSRRTMEPWIETSACHSHHPVLATMQFFVTFATGDEGRCIPY